MKRFAEILSIGITLRSKFPSPNNKSDQGIDQLLSLQAGLVSLHRHSKHNNFFQVDLNLISS